MDDESIYLSVVIPAFDEANRIGSTLDRVRAYLEQQTFVSEVLVVVDGGHDDTLDLVQRVADGWSTLTVLHNDVNRGKGDAVRRGMLEARGQFLLFSDADLSTPIDQVERLLTALRPGCDVAIGSRALAGSDVRLRQPWWRQWMGRVFNRIVQQIVVSGYRDTQCGFKCFRREAAHRILARQRQSRFSFDVELIWIASKMGYGVVEVPVVWINDPSSRVHPLRDSCRMLFDLLRLRYDDFRGAYRTDDRD
ncbi:MAG: dolichyl-phosphate beta-glucosyltransferase [Acidobacteriota bacterium]|nr:dolichyl-phosphate beta-glucosyltransferase [Acidobacteriota bacterium]